MSSSSSSSSASSYEPVYTRLPTKAVQSGESGGRVSMQDCLTTPIAQTSAYTFKDTQQLIDFCESRYDSYEYGRYGNPTTRVLEDKIIALEGAEDGLFSSSGMCTNTTCMLALLPENGHLMTTSTMYRRTQGFASGFLSTKLGMTHTLIDQDPDVSMDDMVAQLHEQKPDVLFMECPSGPFLRVLDIKRLSAACREIGTTLVVDATYATPLNQRTIELGADLVTHSASKYLAGHNDVLAGVVVGKKELVGEVRKLHAVLGGVLDPHAAYLVLRGVKTLGIRVEHQNRSALEMAQYLSSVPQVEQVFYPGLPSHPDWDVAKDQMSGYGGVLSFVLRGGKPQARRFLDALRIPYIAPSLGGVESLVEMPSIAWGLSDQELEAAGIPGGLVRFSCGLEDTVDVLTDVANALKQAS